MAFTHAQRTITHTQNQSFRKSRLRPCAARVAYKYGLLYGYEIQVAVPRSLAKYCLS